MDLFIIVLNKLYTFYILEDRGTKHSTTYYKKIYIYISF